MVLASESELHMLNEVKLTVPTPSHGPRCRMKHRHFSRVSKFTQTVLPFMRYDIYDKLDWKWSQEHKTLTVLLPPPSPLTTLFLRISIFWSPFWFYFKLRLKDALWMYLPQNSTQHWTNLIWEKHNTPTLTHSPVFSSAKFGDDGVWWSQRSSALLKGYDFRIGHQLSTLALFIYFRSDSTKGI